MKLERGWLRRQAELVQREVAAARAARAHYIRVLREMPPEMGGSAPRPQEQQQDEGWTKKGQPQEPKRPTMPTSAMSDADLSERASNLVRDLCNGDAEWRMCVPVHPDDSDIILGNLIRRFDELIVERESLRSAAAVGERLRDAINEYDYLRRECPDEATRDTGWQAVLSVFPPREGETNG